MSTGFQNEDQVILRLPEGLASQLRKMIRSGGSSNGIELSMDSKREGVFTMNGTEHEVTLVDLPCIIETQKTLDNRTYYKSGSISQMLLVQNEEGWEQQWNDRYEVDSGLTPPTRNIRRRKFKHIEKMKREEVQPTENELIKRIRGESSGNGAENVELVSVDAIKDIVKKKDKNTIVTVRNTPKGEKTKTGITIVDETKMADEQEAAQAAANMPNLFDQSGTQTPASPGAVAMSPPHVLKPGKPSYESNPAYLDLRQRRLKLEGTIRELMRKRQGLESNLQKEQNPMMKNRIQQDINQVNNIMAVNQTENNTVKEQMKRIADAHA